MVKQRATRHQKFLKSEKSKTKLKAKKVLPKGTNDTKTAFKIKKIVIRDHAKQQSTDELLSNTKLTLKELLSRCEHFNTASRDNALSGIRDLITKYPDEMLTLNVSKLITGVSPMVLDKEKTVRREAYKTLHFILSPLSSDKIEPFFDILCSYLRCAMTHINSKIHEDSLFLFDVLLECVPELIAKNFHKILPSFLDMISKLRVDCQPGRTLVMNLGSKMTSVKWRTKVLLRLLQFLRALIKSKFESKGMRIESVDNISLLAVEKSITSDKIKCCTRIFDKEKEQYFPIYQGLNFATINFSTNDSNTPENQNILNDDKLRLYAESLMPLLFEAWLEVRPMSSNSKKVESVVSEEGMNLLQYILEIIMLLWQLLQFGAEESKNTEITKWFLDTYRSKFAQYFLVAFPYSQTATKNKKGNNDKNDIGEISLQQNLRICHIYVLLNEKTEKSNLDKIEIILKYIKWTLDQVSNKSVDNQLQIANIFGRLLKSVDWSKNKEMIPLLQKIIVYSNEDVTSEFKQNIFELLCSILLNEKLNFLQSSQCFQEWLSNLPKMLYEQTTISEKSYNIITKFAIQNNKLFNESIRKDLKHIIKNLPNIQIVEIENKIECGKRIVALLYWVNRWDNDSLNILQDQLADGAYDSSVRQYLMDLLKLKSEGLIPM